MLHWLVNRFEDDLEAAGLGFLRVFSFPSFQAAVGVLLSFLIVMLLAPRVIGWLRKQKIGDNASFDQAQLDAQMKDKKNTPTMGGTLIIASITFSTLLLADVTDFFVQMALICLIWLGAVGAVDDWLKLTLARRQGSRDGLRRSEKLLFQVGLAVLLCVFTYDHGHAVGLLDRLYLPSLKEPVMHLSIFTFTLVGVVVIVGSSNAVNLTDGLDGLASGCVAIAAFVLIIFALIIGDLRLSTALLFHHVDAAGQMAVVAAAMAGACMGFLWFNCNPARVFMGDTGSLALGGLLGYIAIVLRQETLLLVLGGVFVVEALSVLVQIYVFKITRILTGTGRRVLRMAPIHHHFQILGWSETQTVVRFWLIGAMLAMVAVATIKLR